MQEIELKFLVPEYRLDGLMRQTKVKSSLTSLLAAHYFDTPDQVLAANGMALRIRKEGDRWVQTLKSNGDGMASRGEQNNVLDSQMVAEALATDTLSPDLSLYDTLDITQLVASPDTQRTTDALACQYITEVQRTTRLIKKDDSTIELAYDEGRVIHGEDSQISQPIHEIEFELIEGDVHFLFETAKTWCRRYNLCLSTVTKAERGGLLLAGKQHAEATKADLRQLAVHKKMSQPQFLRAVVHNCMIQILPNASAIADGSTDSAHVHQLRVGIRRLRTALRFFKDFSSQINPEWAPILKQTFSLLGDYRDRELLQTRTQPMLEKLGGPAVDWSEERAAIRIKPIDAVRANDFQITLLELIEYTMSPAKKDRPLIKHSGTGSKTKGAKKNPAKLSTQQATSELLEALYTKISQASDQFASLSTDAQHDVRKRLKSLRYVSEFTAALYKDKKSKAFLKYLEPAQEILGEYNDDIVGQYFYGQKAQQDPNAWFAVGYFSAQEVHAANQCAQSLKSIKDAPKFW